MLIDSHVHLASYDSHEVSEIVRRASDAKVDIIITASTTLESSRQSVELARIFPTVYAGIGIHPNRLREPLAPDAYDTLRELAASSPRVVAISETGLDFLPNGPIATGGGIPVSTAAGQGAGSASQLALPGA